MSNKKPPCQLWTRICTLKKYSLTMEAHNTLSTENVELLRILKDRFE